MKLCCWRVKREGCFVLLYTSSSCPLSDHWECFSCELWGDGNITIMLFSVTVFSFLGFFDLYRLYSIVYFIVVFSFFLLIANPSPLLKDILSHCQIWHFRQDRVSNWCSVNFKCSKYSSLNGQLQQTSWLLLLLLDLKSKWESSHYVSFRVGAQLFFVFFVHNLTLLTWSLHVCIHTTTHIITLL